MGLATFETQFHGDGHELVAARFPSSTGDHTPPSGETAAAPVLAAEVYQGRWLARCPFCTGAEYVSFDHPVFFCCECRNEAVGHAYLPVDAPGGKKRAEVDAYLEARPRSARNFLRGETVADLRRENGAAGWRLT